MNLNLKYNEICGICNRECFTQKAIDDCTKRAKLNVGSGKRIFPSHINYDAQKCIGKYGETDVIGWVESIVEILPTNFFKEILCAHVIEHFYYSDAIKVLEDFKKLLVVDGVLILEAPNLIGIIELHQAGYHRAKTERQLVTQIFGNEVSRLKWGNHWVHKSMWTPGLISDVLEKLGFKIRKTGVGKTHGMGKRDFRIEAVKEE